MNQYQYCITPEIEYFSRWLSEVITGKREINFLFDEKQSWRTLNQCLMSYSWPDRLNNGPKKSDPLNCEFPEEAKFKLGARSSLIENDVVLTRLGKGLKNALDSGHTVEPWVLSIFQWGGMLAGAVGVANKNWVSNNRTRLPEILKEGCEAFRSDDDEIVLPNFRFNASMTKIYSLLLHNFLIYDSRVGAAFAWLVNTCYQGRQIPELLKFPLPPSKSKSTIRNPRPYSDDFPSIRNDPIEYAKWNVRANWVLTNAMRYANENPGNPNAQETQFESLRQLEAALFTMGRDLTFAM